MAFSHTDIATLTSAFMVYAAERNMNDQQRLEYLFDVLHRSRAEQRAERKAWVQSEQRRVQRLLDSSQERVDQERASLNQRKVAADAVETKIDAENGA